MLNPVVQVIIYTNEKFSDDIVLTFSVFLYNQHFIVVLYFSPVQQAEVRRYLLTQILSFLIPANRLICKHIVHIPHVVDGDTSVRHVSHRPCHICCMDNSLAFRCSGKNVGPSHFSDHMFSSINHTEKRVNTTMKGKIFHLIWKIITKDLTCLK